MDLVNSAMSRAKEAAGVMGDWTADLAERYEERKASVKTFVEKWMKLRFKEQAEVLVDRIPSYVKKSFYDPYMPRCVKAILHKSINNLWPDIKQEIMWELSVMIDGNEEQHNEDMDTRPAVMQPWRFFRYRLFPYNKGIWECLRDPIFVLMNVLCYVPFFGIWSWMFLVIFLIIDKKDEYQLVYFILSFKGCQFFSWGVVKGLVGFMQYFACVTFPKVTEMANGINEPDPERCMTSGPGMGELYWILVASWLTPLVLVWLSLFLLRFAEEKGRSTLGLLEEAEDEKRAKEEAKAAQAEDNADNAADAIESQNTGTTSEKSLKDRKAKTSSGGYLPRMVIFDFVIFVLVVVLLVVIVLTQPHQEPTTAVTTLFNAGKDDWQVKQTFYCCQFIYGLFSIVFVPFNLPFLQAVLTHSAPTAYDSKGRCCKFKGPAKPPEDEEEKGIRRGVSSILGKESMDNFTSNLKTAMAGGKVSMEEMQTKVRNRASSLGVSNQASNGGDAETQDEKSVV